ncbi:MAG: DUF4255 domain-containing protein [Leptolyngbyaceae bacterium]|nr:DUF4255 domain-containing protein [Leptolyngbyaceae bacterium]
MSNQLAIAAVTATLQRILQATVQEDVFGARVTAARPNTLEGGMIETGVNLYLYLITPNPAYTSNEQPVRRPNRDLVKRSLVASDLQFLLSFYGSDAEMEPQRLAGSVIRTFQNVYALTPEMIRETIADPTFGFLAGADLSDQIEPVRIVPTEISVENLSKIWSVFFQTPYALSLTYKATVVLIEGEESGKKPLPIRERRTTVVPFRQLFVDRVISASGSFQPITLDSTLVITGRNLYHESVRVRIADVDVEPTAVTPSQIQLALPSIPAGVLRAGVQSLQVIHPRRGERSPGESSRASSRESQEESQGDYSGAESNLASFVLRPTVTSVQVESVEPIGHDRCRAVVTVETAQPIDPDQRVILILNEWSRQDADAYMEKASGRRDTSHAVQFTLDRIEPGDYLVRLQVNGAESLLEVDHHPASATFNWYVHPRVQIQP